MNVQSDENLLLEILDSFFSQRDTKKLCEIVLKKAMDLTNADGGTLYLVNLDNPRLLDFSIVINRSLNISMGGTSNEEIKFPPIEILSEKTNERNNSNIASYAALNKKILNIEDAYHNGDFDFTGMQKFDKKNKYHSKSFLVLPLLNHNSEVVGVIQLINAQDFTNNNVISFDESFESILEVLANFSALALENALLTNEKNKVLIELLAEKDVDRLLENILKEAMKISRADSGMLYMIDGNDNKKQLTFEYFISNNLNSRANRIPELDKFKPLPLFNNDGVENNRFIVCNVANNKNILNIENIYQDGNFDLSNETKFYEITGYKCQSLLVVPLLNNDSDVIGVIQLINATDTASNKTVAFSKDLEPVITALTQYAAIVVNLQILLEDHRLLLDSFVKCIAGAIDEKSQHTSAHCQNIPIIMDMMVDAVIDDKEYFPYYHVSEEQRHEIQVASWLHDCGKLTTPDSILEKSTKLDRMTDGIHEINLRFLALKNHTEINYLKKIHNEPENQEILKKELAKKVDDIEGDRKFIEYCNVGSEFLSEGHKARIRHIQKITWENHLGETQNLLSNSEVSNLSISKGTINKEEREIINNHMQVTIDMLNSLHFPKNLSQVPEIAGGHHEKMNGKGFPMGLTGDKMSIPARMMAIADIFEALTSQERPYKKPMTLSQTLNIMSRMVDEQHIDKNLFSMFLKQGVWQRYSKAHLNPEQLDISDISVYL